MSAGRQAPGPSWHELPTRLRWAKWEPLRLLSTDWRLYGDVVRYHIGRQDIFLLHHPEAIRQVLQQRNRNYRRSDLFEELRPVLGNGLLTTEGEDWMRHRRLMQPMFTRQRVEAMIGEMHEAIDADLSRLGREAVPGRPLDLGVQMGRLTLEVAARLLFHADLGADGEELRKSLEVAVEVINARTSGLFAEPRQWPSPRNLRLRRAAARMDRIVRAVITARRRSGAPAQGDLLTTLMEAQDDEDRQGFDDQAVRDEAMTLIIAGHETTANLLSWTWFRLGQHREVMDRLRAEVDEVLGDGPPTPEALGRLRWTDQVLREVLRLHPPAWAVDRQAIADDELEGYAIPAGSLVIMFPFTAHRHPAIWPQPESFDPSRFAPGAGAERPRFAWMPFGAGPHKCIGEHFAMIEATMALAMMVQRFDVALVDAHHVRPRPSVTLGTLDGVMATVAPRA